MLGMAADARPAPGAQRLRRPAVLRGSTAAAASQSLHMTHSRQPSTFCRPFPAPFPPCSDASPIRVELRDTRPGVLRLLVRVCAVVGGAFAVTGLLDKIIEGLLRDVRKAVRSHTHTQ